MDLKTATADQIRRGFLLVASDGGPKLVDARRLEALMVVAAQASARQLLRAATESVVELLGERGSCVLVDGEPRVVFATHAPEIKNLPVELARYPEIMAALDSRSVVAIEDVETDARLAAVRELLPKRLGSVAVVPLFVGDHRMGVMMVQSSEKRGASPEAIATAGLIGQFTALVLEARLGKRIDLVLTGTQEVFVPEGISSARLASATEEEAASSSTRRILIVEDDPQRARPLAAALRHDGYEVVCTYDGLDGIKRALTSPPQALLLGVCLPGLDGISVAERLREDPRTQAVPIFFLSGVDDLLPRARGTTFDNVEFLPRSLALPELLNRIERALR